MTSIVRVNIRESSRILLTFVYKTQTKQRTQHINFNIRDPPKPTRLSRPTRSTMHSPAPSASSTLRSGSRSPSPPGPAVCLEHFATTPVPNDDLIACVLQDAQVDPTFAGHPNAFPTFIWRDDVDGRQVLVDAKTGHPLKLWFVGDICPRQFWLQACGMWSHAISSYRNDAGNNKKTGFEDHVATGFIAEPFASAADDALKQLFRAQFQNIQKLEASMEKINPNGHLAHVDHDGNRIKIRHRIFEVTTYYSLLHTV